MRISLLLQREPLGELLEETLGSFWTEQQERPVQVTWRPGLRQKNGSMTGNSNAAPAHSLCCNFYLNSIFDPNVDRTAFDPIKREFSRSTIAWRRPVQRTYVNLATHPTFCRWFSQATLHVDTDIEGLSQQIIVPGNQKLRILDHRRREATCILKRGFSSECMEREVQSRARADALGIPVPSMIESSPSHSWFREEYIAATPLNRLADLDQQRSLHQKTLSAIRKLTESTTVESPTAEYLAGLLSEIRSLVKTLPSPSANDRETARRVDPLATTLAKRIADTNIDRVNVGLTHGDFQPANVLVDDNRFWIIDWENSRSRQTGYDLLVSQLKARFSLGLASRMKELLDREGDSMMDWPGLSKSRSSLRFHLDLFALEELNSHLHENSNSMFRCQSPGLQQITNEVRQWLNVTNA